MHGGAGFSPPPAGRSQDDFILPDDSPVTATKLAPIADTPSRHPWLAPASPSRSGCDEEPEAEPPPGKLTMALHRMAPQVESSETTRAAPAAAFRPLNPAPAFRPLSAASPGVQPQAFFKFVPALAVPSSAADAAGAEAAAGSGGRPSATGTSGLTPSHSGESLAMSCASFSSASNQSDSFSAASPLPAAVSACPPADMKRQEWATSCLCLTSHGIFRAKPS